MFGESRDYLEYSRVCMALVADGTRRHGRMAGAAPMHLEFSRDSHMHGRADCLSSSILLYCSYTQ
eukprot:COSAG05_NODE_2061_length_3624_cov_5.109787_1_plen_65_part_00